MWLERLRFEFGVELATDEIGMIGQLNHFYIGAVGGRSRDAHSGRSQRSFVLTVELVAMTVTFADFEFAIHAVSKRVGFDFASPGAKPHSSTEFFHATQFPQLVDDPVRCGWIELAGVGIGKPAHIASKLDTSRLHA